MICATLCVPMFSPHHRGYPAHLGKQQPKFPMSMLLSSLIHLLQRWQVALYLLPRCRHAQATIWRFAGKQWPILFSVTRVILASPAASTGRTFSKYGALILHITDHTWFWPVVVMYLLAGGLYELICVMRVQIFGWVISLIVYMKHWQHQWPPMSGESCA
jgi:hypothetical protein